MIEYYYEASDTIHSIIEFHRLFSIPYQLTNRRRKILNPLIK